MRISDWSSDVCSSDLPNIWPNEAPNLWRKRCSGERWLRSAKRVWMERAMALNSRICRMLGIEHPIVLAGMGGASVPALARSEEHTSELLSLMRNSYAVFCLKKKSNIQPTHKRSNSHRNRQ